MFVRSGIMTMPAMTVAQDLLSRVGSPTKYSLSPFDGYGDYKGSGRETRDDVKRLRESGYMELLLKLKDDFSFGSRDAMYTLYECIEETEGLEEAEQLFPDGLHVSEIIPYAPGDTHRPEYIRRFEDGYSRECMNRYIDHVLSNIMRNDNGIKAYKNTIVKYRETEDDESVNDCEMQTERLVNDDSNYISFEDKTTFAYCLYRMNKLSARVGVNMFSLILAYMRSAKKIKTKLPSKPAALISEGVYYADINGNCTTMITQADDKALTRARDIFSGYSNKVTDEFVEDYHILTEAMHKMNIDINAEDPKIYNKEMVNNIAQYILVNNYSYVVRSTGGYNKDVLRKLKNLSLDEARHASVEIKEDKCEKAYNIIMRSPWTPGDVYLAFQRKVPECDLDMAIYVANATAEMDDSFAEWASRKPTHNVSPEGFLLDTDGNYVELKCPKIVGQQYAEHTFGGVFFHVSRYVVFSPTSEVVLLCTLDEFLHKLQISGTITNFIQLGSML